jgi:hypothetical protein
MTRSNLRKDRLDLWQPDLRRQPDSVDWWVVSGMLALVVSAVLTGWMLYKGTPLLVQALAALVD